MSTQYIKIQRAYDELRKSDVSLIEHANVQSAVAPFIEGARVLELACGSGFYSYDFLKWGASAVVGVDISTAMIEEARSMASTQRPYSDAGTGTIDFKVADCSIPVAHDEGPFDLVFAAWLLNYARSGNDMIEMFRNVSLNLKEVGRFIAITPPPREDPAAFVEEERKIRPLPEGSGGLFLTTLGEVEDGIECNASMDTKFGKLSFDCYHLRKSIFEAAAREGGMEGELKWSLTEVPVEFLCTKRGGTSLKELESYKVTPHYGMLVVVK